jgi:hypothetical protein
MHTLELELLLRPADGTVVSLIAQRLQTRLLDERNGLDNDHRVRKDSFLPATATTVAPVGRPGWTVDTGEVWNRVEWTERHGTLPACFELRLPRPQGPVAATRALANDLARFIAADLQVPVTWSVIDANVPRPGRTSHLSQVRFCFPTRALPQPGQPPVVDRSGNPSGFGGRLVMVANTRVMKQFELRVAAELRRLESGAGWPATRPAERSEDIFPFEEADPGHILPPAPARPEISETLHPHVARLRREGPRGSTVMELRDFDLALGFATTVEDALRDVVSREEEYIRCGEGHTRLQSQVLDHSYLLDRARCRRAGAQTALRELQDRRPGLFHFARGKMELASLARERHHREMTLANTHVQELKAAIEQLQARARVGAHEAAMARSARDGARDELRVAVRALHAADPRVLSHLLGILTGAERACLKAAMAKPADDALPLPVEGDAAEDTRAGPPAKPTRRHKPA